MAALRPDPRPSVSPLTPWFTVALWTFVGTIVFSVAGLLLLRLVPSAMDLFGPYYATLVKAPTWTYMALLPVLPILMYVPALRWRRLSLYLAWGCFVGGASELIGTTGTLTVSGVALPFGAYTYTSWLGPKLLGHVPYFIPLSWFAMSLLSYDLAGRVAASRWARVGIAALFMVLWDVALDPAMNEAFPFWQYAVDGFFYGMPLSNWIGWFVVSFVIMAGYEWMGGLPVTSPWAGRLYALNGSFPLMISLLHGIYLGALVGALAVAIPPFWARRRPRHTPNASFIAASS